MRYAPVIPPAHIDKLEPRKDIAYFCFADVAAKNYAYRRWFDDKNFVVLDCPVYEGGDILPALELKKLVRDMPGIEFCIIPDVIDHKQETLARFYDYVSIIDSPTCTGVPQGRTVEEVVDCAMEMLAYGGIRRLAVPNKRAWSGQATRAQFITAVVNGAAIADHLTHHKRGFEVGHVKWHLLGAEFPYHDEMEAAAIPGVISLDTAEPVNAAIKNRQFDSHEPFIRRRPDYFFDTPKHLLVPRRLNGNVGDMQSWLNSSVTTAELSDEAQSTPM